MSKNMTEEVSQFVEEQGNIKNYIEKVYSTRVPPPESPNTSFWNLVGLKTAFFSISSLGAIVFSAIRTGGYFYLVEVVLLSKFNIPETMVNILALSAFIAALFAFEGYALADGFSRGEKMNGVEQSNFGLYSSFATIMLVGVFSGLEIAELSDSLRNNLSILVAILTSISAASIAFFGGKNLGFAVGEFKKKKKDLLIEHQASYDTWRDGAFRSYTSTMGSVKSRVQFPVQKPFNSEHDSEQNDESVQPMFKREKKMSKSELAYEFVNNFVNKYGEIPKTTVDISQENFKKTYLSYAINDYICTNAEGLLQDGLVTQERMKQACGKVKR